MERWSWSLGALFLAAALAGFAGRGPLSHARIERGQLAVEYDRFERRQAPSELRVVVGAGATRDAVLRLWVGREYAEEMDISRIVPTPATHAHGSDRITYSIHSSDASSLRITLHVNPIRYGMTRGRIGIVGGPDVDFRQVFPDRQDSRGASLSTIDARLVRSRARVRESKPSAA